MQNASPYHNWGSVFEYEDKTYAYIITNYVFCTIYLARCPDMGIFYIKYKGVNIFNCFGRLANL